MMSKMQDTTGATGPDWQIKENWGDNCQAFYHRTDKYKKELQNPNQTKIKTNIVPDISILDLEDIEDTPDSILDIFLDLLAPDQ